MDGSDVETGGTDMSKQQNYKSTTRQVNIDPANSNLRASS